MTMETKESNKLIAEFMGLKMNVNGSNAYSRSFLVDEFGNKICQPDSLKYHESWDRLMPAVSKIVKMKLTAELVSDSPREHNLGMNQLRYLHNSSVNWLLDINLMYKNVIQFVEWFNKHKIDSDAKNIQH